jgi:hypothetical protein
MNRQCPTSRELSLLTAVPEKHKLLRGRPTGRRDRSF